jgi:hypothetical protein
MQKVLRREKNAVVPLPVLTTVEKVAIPGKVRL